MKSSILVLLILALVSCGKNNSNLNKSKRGINISNVSFTPAAKGSNAAMFMKITNFTNSDDTLASAVCSSCQLVQIHKSFKTEDGRMGMKKINELEIPFHKSVSLKHGGFHLMLIGVSRDFKFGDKITVKLNFKHSGEITVTGVVKSN